MYNNPANLDHHYRCTGPNTEQMPDIDAFCRRHRYRGTVMGVGKFLKSKNQELRFIAATRWLPSSTTHSSTVSPGRRERLLVEGIGKQWLPGIFDFALIDDVIQVDDKESFLMTREILVSEGIFAGASSGSAVVGALRWISGQATVLTARKC
jgi:cystathionine beta-synthase